MIILEGKGQKNADATELTSLRPAPPFARFQPLAERGIQSVIIPIAVVATAITAVVIPVIPAPVMIVITLMIAVVVPAMAVTLIKIRHTSAQQNGGSHSQQHRCHTLHSTLP
jgi:hypothetical protein